MPVTTRYLLRQFFGVFTPLMGAFVALYIIVDFLDRLDVLLRHDATLSAGIRYFLFKVPLMITQLLPAAALVSTLLSLGILARSNEIVAWRACGVGLWQTARPLLAAAALISVAALVWDETVVPYSTTQFEHVNRIEIRKKGKRSIFSERDLWYHGKAGFYNIDLVDARKSSLYGVTIYQLTPTFSVSSITQIRQAIWKGTSWDMIDVVEHRIDSDGNVQTAPSDDQAELLQEPLDDFLEVKREPEELSYLDLRRRIDGLSRKGIDASHLLVDLHLKLAVPFAVLTLTWVAIPIAGSVRRHASIPQTLAAGLAIGFGYWVVLGFARSLGETGVLDPILAAWAANGIMSLVGLGLFLGRD